MIFNGEIGTLVGRTYRGIVIPRGVTNTIIKALDDMSADERASYAAASLHPGAKGRS